MNSDAPGQSLLLYEPRTEGHHLVWLRFITEDLLSAGRRLTLAVDTRPEPFEAVRKRLGSLLHQVQVTPAWDSQGRKIGGGGARATAACLDQAGSSRVFVDTFDEIASQMLRRAAFGRWPPQSLRGRMGGIYLRPRFLLRRGCSFNEWLKSVGFSRLMRGGWLSQMLFLDPWVQARCQARFPNVRSYFLPDPCPDDFAGDAEAARRRFEVPAGRKVLLFYGGAYRRKGLHLAVEALVGLKSDAPVFLICAGQQADDPATRDGLQTLVNEGRARLVTRYIFEEEEKALFAASDMVLLPYIRHFGNSAVLSRAAAAGKAVVASDEELVGRMVREYALGPLFESGNVPALRQAILQAVNAPQADQARWAAGAQRYATVCSRAEFRKTLITALA